jgi:hypothetical protein
MSELFHINYHNVRTVPYSNKRFVETVIIDMSNIYIHDYSLSWLGTIKSCGAKLILCAQIPPLNEMMFHNTCVMLELAVCIQTFTMSPSSEYITIKSRFLKESSHLICQKEYWKILTPF